VEGVLLVMGAFAVLGGLGALLEGVRQRRGVTARKPGLTPPVESHQEGR
jgi:hypothetical protein